MAQFGQKSTSRLSTCTRDIQTIMMEVVKHFDCMIVEGNRTAERQHEHWAKGRQLVNSNADTTKRDNWEVKDKSKIVTYKDGYEKKSRHQNYPSDAVDVVPYPSLWADKNKLIELAGAIRYCQSKLLKEGRIETTLNWGGDWHSFKDRPHWEIKKND